MSDIHIRTSGRAGRITLTRPRALNALSYDMAMAIDAALVKWRDDADVALVIIDAEGDKAFCAGGDIQQLYDTGMGGDFAYGQRFWRDEYRLNARLAEFPKPIVSFMQGFVMGGGVGVGCHVSHRVVDDATQIAMPECGIGLVPDVGGSLLLARAPGRLGEFLGLTAERMGPAEAQFAGFADGYAPRASWGGLIAQLEDTGDISTLDGVVKPVSSNQYADQLDEITRLFSGDLPQIIANLEAADSDIAARALKAMRRNSPLAMAATLQMLEALRAPGTGIREALAQEYRFTARAMEHGDFLEGIRAQIIDRDRNPQWNHDVTNVPESAVQSMLAPLSGGELSFGEEET